MLADDEATASIFEQAMAPALKRLASAGMDARPVRLRGSVAGDAIAAYARKRRLELVVMGSHGHGALRALVLGSVAMRVAARCDTPLLLIREPGRAAD